MALCCHDAYTAEAPRHGARERLTLRDDAYVDAAMPLMMPRPDASALSHDAMRYTMLTYIKML